MKTNPFQSNHDYILVGPGIQKFNTNRLLPLFGVIKKDKNDKYSKNVFDSYKKKSGVYVWLKVQDNKKVVDAGLVRTYSTLKKLDDQFKNENCTMLLHPYTVTIPEGFWLKWKTANNSQDRISLIKEHNLIKDEAIYKIDKIVLDIDSPVEYAQWQLENFIFPELGITEGYEIGRTKSGNTRAILYLKWSLKANDVFRKQKHIERLRELYYFLIDYFYYLSNLKLDKTFADRINHPIWFSFNSHFYQKTVSKPGKIPFYTLYGRMKQIQKRFKYWVTRDKMNLTLRFWGDRRPERKSTKVQLPAFLRNELKSYIDEDYKLTLWKKAVKSLYKGRGYRFTNFILPAIGWAKYLNLDRIDVDEYIKGFLADRDYMKTEKDLDIAWKYANELEFKIPETKKQIKLPANLDLIQLTEKALNLVKQTSKTRQELLHEIFYKQAWLCDLVMNFLEKKGLVRSEFVKSGKRGRPSKVYHFVNSNNKTAQVKQEQKQTIKSVNNTTTNNNSVNNNNNNQINNHNQTKEIQRNDKVNSDKPINNMTVSNTNQNTYSQSVYKDTDISSDENETLNNKTKRKKKVYIQSISEWIADCKNYSQYCNGNIIYIYDPVVKQRVPIEGTALYFYERERQIAIKSAYKIVTRGPMLSIIRYDRDYVFNAKFKHFRFTKMPRPYSYLPEITFSYFTQYYFITNENYASVADEYVISKPKLDYQIFSRLRFRFLSEYALIDIAFVNDVCDIKIWADEEKFETFHFTQNKKERYDHLLTNNKNTQTTIKDRRYYTKARSIRENVFTNVHTLFDTQSRMIKNIDSSSSSDNNKKDPSLQFTIGINHGQQIKDYHLTLADTD